MNQLGTWGKDDRGYHYWKLRAGGKPIVIKRKELSALKTAVKKRIAELSEKGVLAQVSSDPTVEKKLNLWLETKVKPYKADNTYRSYKQNADNYLIPWLGKIKWGKLNSDHIQVMVAGMMKQGLGGTTINHAVTVLCNCAGKRRALELKEGLVLPSAPPPGDRALDEDEILSVIDECFKRTAIKSKPGEWRWEYRNRYLLVFILNSGVRVSEALGAMIFDVSFKGGEEHVHLKNQLKWKAGSEGSARTWSLIPLKGKQGRKIPLNDQAVGVLRDQMAMIAMDKKAAGRGYEDNGLLFPTESGRPMDARAVLRTLTEILKKLGLEHATVHDLRRSYLTHLAAVEERMQFVSAIAGHSNIQTTAKIYIVAKELGKRQAAMKVDFTKATEAKRRSGTE